MAIAAAARANTTAQGLIDASTIANKIAAAGNFMSDLGSSSESIFAYGGAGAATSARALVAGVGGDTTVVATYAATVQSTIASIFDAHIDNTCNLTAIVNTIVGGPGNNVFNAALNNTVGLAARGETRLSTAPTASLAASCTIRLTSLTSAKAAS